MRKSAPTQDRLRELLNYDPETGCFQWKNARGRGAVNREAGRLSNHGYRQITVDGVRYLSHRLAWLYVYNCWPICEVDHVNRVRHDNRIANLRLASRLQNARNMPEICSSNTSGVRGVCWDNSKKKWLAYIIVNNKQVHLGRFAEMQHAASARRAAARRVFGEFTSE